MPKQMLGQTDPMGEEITTEPVGAEPAEPEGGADSSGTDPKAAEPEDKTGDSKTAKYTDDDVNAIIERRLAREREKWSAEVEKKQQEATEAEKLKGMNELEREKYEKEQLAARVAELEQAKNLSEQMSVARKELNDAGIRLSDDLLRMFVSPEADSTKTALDNIKRLWPESLNAAVQEALKSTPPKNPSGAGEPKSDGAKFAEKYNATVGGKNA